LELPFAGYSVVRRVYRNGLAPFPCVYRNRLALFLSSRPGATSAL